MGRNHLRIAAALAVVCSIAGCTVNVGGQSGSGTPKVSKEDLQKDITQRLITVGKAPQSVTCENDLFGQPGQSTRCEVAMGIDSLEPIVTVSSVDGNKVNYDIVPSVSKTQLAAAVAQMVGNSGTGGSVTVGCASGLDGKVGAKASCDVTTQGVASKRTVAVTEVSGLLMKYGLVTVLPKQVVESTLLMQLNRAGQHPDAAGCPGDLEGSVGNSMECTTVTAGQTKTYILTVTEVKGDNITYKYAEKP